MTKPKYDLVFFDADETLYDYKKCEENAFFQTLNEFCPEKKENHLSMYKYYQEINSFLWNEYHLGKIKKDYILKVRFEKLIEKSGLQTDPRIFGKKYLLNLSDQSFLIKSAIYLTEELSKFCKLVIITNGVSNVQHTRLSKSAIKSFISAIIVSGDHPNNPKFQKPNIEIFEYAHIKYGSKIPKDKILMVGDSLISDVAGGINYGINTCWLNENQQINNTIYTPTYEITNLNLLLKIVL